MPLCRNFNLWPQQPLFSKSYFVSLSHTTVIVTFFKNEIRTTQKCNINLQKEYDKDRTWKLKSVLYAVFCLTINYTNTPCRQLQRDIINVSDQQKTDVILFIKRPTCSLYQCITVKLFASGTATCLFSFNKDFQPHDSLIFKQWNTKRRKLDPQ